MSSSGRREGSGGRGGEKSCDSADHNPRGASSFGRPSSGQVQGGGGGLGSPSRLGHFAKYTKPKIGHAFQCAVPKFVPPARDLAGLGKGGGGGGGSEAGDESDGSASGSSVGASKHGTRSRVGGKGGGGGGGGRKGARGGRRGGAGGIAAATASSEGTSRKEQSIASGETSAVDIANAAAEHLQDRYGARAIPRGGLCVHKPHWGRIGTSFHAADELQSEGAAMDPRRPPPHTTTAMDDHEDFLTFTRNVFLQTPRPHCKVSIDDIWDDATVEKYKVDAPPAPDRSDRGAGRGRGNKRKATVASLTNDVAVEDEELLGSAPYSPKKSMQVGEIDAGVDMSEEASSIDVEQSVNEAEAKLVQDRGAATDLLPLCGLEDDEQALSYLQTTCHGDPQIAKLSIMVDSDRGYGVQRRRQLRKKRKEDNKSYPDATAFTSESWRWRVHHARPTMLGDYRSSRDSTYHYFDPAPIPSDNLISGSHPWRLRRIGDDADVTAADEESSTRSRSYSITWSAVEIDKAKQIWRSILAYTKSALGKMEDTRDNDSKPSLRDLLELVGKAHALPTPEEAFGRRDPSSRQMSEDMNSVIDAIERGRDYVARILKCLRDDGEGVEIDVLMKLIDEIERTCPVELTELDTVKKQVHEATLWEEKLENNIDHGIADSNSSDGEDVITEKKLTLEKVERLVSIGWNLTLRPQSLIRLQSRVEDAHILQRRIVVWNEAKNQENPQNLKFVSTLIKQANKIDLAFPELFTLTGVHKKAEKWIDRASIAVRTTISFEELESLVATGEGLPLNVSDVLEKLQNRLKQAKDWMIRVEEIVPKSDDYLMWLRRFRHSLEDSDKNAHLLSLLSEGSRIPVTMDCSKLLQIEIDARHWTTKAKPWIPENLGTPGEICPPQKRGKVDDIEECLDRASSIRDRLWFGDKEKSEWVLDGESELAQMLEMAESFFEKYDGILSNDSRRNGKLCLPMYKLRAIVDEVNRIPLNLGNQATKICKMFSQADEWMMKYYPLMARCGIECSYTPADAESMAIEPTTPLKIEELSSAVADADSDLSVDLEEVVNMRVILDQTQNWIDQVNGISTKTDTRKKGKQAKYTMEDISDLIKESSSMIVDVTDELEHLKLEQSIMVSWRLQAQQTIREITSAFNTFRKERADACSEVMEPNNIASDVSPGEDLMQLVHQIVPGSMTTRHIDLRRGISINSCPSGSETPAYAEIGGKHLFSLVSSYFRSVKSMNVITPEAGVADELNDVVAWLTKTFRLMNNPSDIYDRKNYSKLDKAIESGQILVDFNNLVALEIPEDTKMIGELRQSWAAAVEDDIGRLLDLQIQRDKFVEWCEKATGIISSTDKKVTIDELKELEKQSAGFPSSSEIVLRVKERTIEATSWVATVADIIKTGQKVPLDQAKELTDAGEKLNIICPEFKTLRLALRATRGWLLRVKKCGVSNGHAQVAVSTVTELINEHNTFLVTAMDELSELKHVMCGYCVCRQPYEGFMIGCDGCEEWYHGACVGITQEQAQKFDKYVCVRCSTLRVYKENAVIVAGILRKWTSAKGLALSRSADSQRYGRKVRSAEREIVKAKADLEKYERDLSNIQGALCKVPSQINGESGASSAHSQPQDSIPSASIQNGKLLKSEKALQDKIGRARATIVSCEKRMEGYKVELVERKNLEAREDALAIHLKKWCNMVKQEVLAPSTREKVELSRPRNDGTTSAPMDKAVSYAEALGIANLPDIDGVLNSFKIFSWCLHALEVLMRKPRVEEIRSLLSHSDSGYFKLPEAKCVRMLRSMASRAQIWQSKAKKALTPVPGEKEPYDLAVLQEILLAAKQIPLTMPEEARLWNTIEDQGTRHCICGGPSDGSFMLGCDSCDRWFHGSCMKIDKTTGDALSNWICPQCSKGVLAQVVEDKENSVIAVGDQKLHAQESFVNPPLSQQLHLDISPHAPNPQTLWPPFGLRSSKESCDALGIVGESDNEDFERPVQPVIREKSESNSSQFYFPQSVLSFAQTPSCQPVASAASTTAPSVSQSSFCQPVSSSAGMAASSQNKVGISQIFQGSVPINSLAVSSSFPTTVKTNHPTTALPQLSLAPAPNFVASSAAHHAARPGNQAMANLLNAMKTNHPPTAQLSLAQAPTFVASSAAHHAARPANHAMTNPLNAMKNNHPPTAQLPLAQATNFVASSKAHHAARPGNQAMTNPSNAITTNHPPTALPQLSHATATNVAASSTAHHAARLGNQAMANHLNAMKTNHPPTTLPQLSLAPASNFVASSGAHHAARPGTQLMTNPLKAMGLNGADLSVAVANLDAFVLAAGDGPGLPPTAPPCLQTETVMQGNVVNSAPAQSANGALSQAIPKAP